MRDRSPAENREASIARRRLFAPCILPVPGRRVRRVVAASALALALFAGGSAAQSPGPVTAFIVRADSIATAGGDSALAGAVTSHADLVGAAVGQLLDVAFQAARSGNTAGAQENVDFARRVAQLYADHSGSRAPLELVQTYASWTPAQRQTRAQAMDLEQKAKAARDAGKLDDAVTLLDKARALYERIDDRRSIAVNYGSRGVVDWKRGDFDAVRADYGKALQARRAIDDHILEGKTLNGLGSVAYQTGDYPTALDWYRKAIALRTRTGDLSGLGTSTIYLGNAYFAMGRLTDARDAFERAVGIVQRLGDAEQTFDLLNGLASIYSEMTRTEKANDSYRRAIDIARGAGLTSREVMARRNLADNFRRQGRYTQALGELAACDSILGVHPDAEQSALVLRDRGRTEMNMGELDDARTDLLAFAASADSLDNPTYRITAYLNVGYLYREMGAFQRGLEMAQKAKDLAVQAGDARSYRLALALGGEVEQRMGDFAAARAMWQEAHDQDEHDGAKAALLEDRISLANVLAAMGRTEEARAAFYKVLPDVEEADARMLAWVTQFGIGHTFEHENPDSAAAHYEAALSKVEAEGEAIGGGGVRSGFLSGKRRYYYEEVARFYAEQADRNPGGGWQERAFRTMERAKARGLVSLLQEAAAHGTSPEEEKALDALYSLDPKASGYAEDRRRLEARYADLREARVERSLGGLRAGTAVTMDAVARALPRDGALLEYALGDTTSLLWVIDRRGRAMHRLPPRADLERDVEQLRDALTRPGPGDAVARRLARSLYETLVGPVADRLHGVHTLVIIPDGVLFGLPFEALLTGDVTAETPWAKAPFLARSFATVYEPSSTVYVQLAGGEHRAKYDLDLLALGAPDFATLASSASLAPLPYAGEEVRAISADVPRKKREVLTGDAATETALKKALAAHAPRVLHLATHGLVDAAQPALSSVALAAGDGNDGYLHTLEILALRHETGPLAGLVVLSACESARGKISRGEGVVGLSRAFIASGARGVVASLWSVSDESTAQLMKVFYRRMMDKRRSACRALQEARLTLIDDGKYAHPFYWSPFVVIGSERAPW